MIFLKFFFIEKLNYKYPAAAGAGFRFLLILPLLSKKNVQRAETKRSIRLYDIHILKEGQTDRRILLYCYV